MEDQLYSQHLLAVIDGIDKAGTSDDVLALYEAAVAQIGGAYIGVLFLPRPSERLENVCMAWTAPPGWREHYQGQNLCQIDPAIRLCRRSVLPFDWATAPYDPETEPHMKEVPERGRDFNIDKGISVPVPSPGGMIGAVWVAGPDFHEREIHKPLLHTLALHVFHRLEHLVGRRRPRTAWLTEREREVLAWAAEGKTAWEIGCILSLSQRTVEWHMRQVCKKVGASNRLQAIAIIGDMRCTFPK
jgi:LuxR family transcriptional regulator, quorum-sensing system regulator BjaR1